MFHSQGKVRQEMASSMASTSSKATQTINEDDNDNDKEEDKESCLICLGSPIVDRSILPNCSHSLFCFRCILTWIQVSSASYKGKARQTGEAQQDEAEDDSETGRCPLCNRGIGRYILHSVHSSGNSRGHQVNWQRWWLRRGGGGGGGVGSSSGTTIDDEVNRAARRSILEERTRRRRRQAHAASSLQTSTSQADLDFARQIARRRGIYSRGQYAMHLGSNTTTGLGPPPTPSTIRAKPHLLSSALPSFLRRELLSLPLWTTVDSDEEISPALTPGLDVPFLTTYILSLLQHLDVRSEGFVKLLAEVLGDGQWERQLAQHFSHELATFLRFGAKATVRRFDTVVSYEEQLDRLTSLQDREGSSREAVKRRSPNSEAYNERNHKSKRHRNNDESGIRTNSSSSPLASTSTFPSVAFTNREPSSSSSQFTQRSLSPAPAPLTIESRREEVRSKRSLLLQRLTQEKRRAEVTSIPPSTPIQEDQAQSPNSVRRVQPGTPSHNASDTYTLNNISGEDLTAQAESSLRREEHLKRALVARKTRCGQR